MKYTEQQIITAMQGTGGIVSQIIRNLSKLDENTTISRQGLHDRLNKNVTLQEAYTAEQERIGDIVETGFFKALQAEEEWAMKEWFKYKGWSRGYVQRQTIENKLDINPVEAILRAAGLREGGNDRKVDDNNASALEGKA